MNKKTLIASIIIAVVLATLAITGAAFCDWAIYLLPLAIIPVMGWAVSNRKYFFEKYSKFKISRADKKNSA